MLMTLSSLIAPLFRLILLFLLFTHFSLKDLGILNYFLGLEVIIHTECLNYQKYITELLHRYDMGMKYKEL